MSDKPTEIAKGGSVIATDRSVAIGGDASHNVFVTGDANTVAQQGVDLARFLAALAELRRQVRDSDLEPETVELVDAELAQVETHAEKPKPNRALVTGKLATVLGLLKDAAAVGGALVPAARKLGEWAAGLF